MPPPIPRLTAPAITPTPDQVEAALQICAQARTVQAPWLAANEFSPSELRPGFPYYGHFPIEILAVALANRVPALEAAARQLLAPATILPGDPVERLSRADRADLELGRAVRRLAENSTA